MTFSSADIAVLVVAAVLVIGALTMLRAPKPQRSTRPDAEFQDVFVEVTDGVYRPSTITLRRGTPAKLRIHRDGEAGEDFVIEPLSVSRKLPVHKTTTIDLVPDEAGAFEVRSGEGQRRATIVVVSSGWESS